MHFNILYIKWKSYWNIYREATKHGTIVYISTGLIPGSSSVIYRKHNVLQA